MIQTQATCPPEKVEEAVDQDIQAFNQYFQGIGMEPLSRSESAIIKSYLAWKLKVVKIGG
jgi:hypothetical protein